MFKVRSDQIKVFREAGVKDFERRAVEYLRRFYQQPTREYTDESIVRRVQSGTQAAAVYGLLTEQEIMVFVTSSFLLGEKFDTDPRYEYIYALLRLKNILPEDKADLLMQEAFSLYRIEVVRRHYGESGKYR